MSPRHCSVEDAYATLGLEQGVSLEDVKSTYKQLALRTHPDKNPGNAEATAQFQRLSEAYRVLLKHHDRLNGHSNPPYDYDVDYSDDDDYYYSDDDIDLDLYLFMFAELLRGRAQFASRRQYRHEMSETEEEYHERVKCSYEEQVAAEERRTQENAARKAKQESDRQRERLEAEKRQKAKQSKRKAQTKSAHKVAEKVALDQQKLSQIARSGVFAAARSGDSARVKKGVWEGGVDATGGEIKNGCEAFSPCAPQDPQETLLHISARNGDAELVQWLDAHGADPEERNSEGLTALHIALQKGYVTIVKYFLNSYPPQEPEHKPIYETRGTHTLLSLAVDSNEPEVVSLILDKSLAITQDIRDVWERVSSSVALPQTKNTGDADKIRNLLMTWGDFDPPLTPKTGLRGKAYLESPTHGPLTNEAIRSETPSSISDQHEEHKPFVAPSKQKQRQFVQVNSDTKHEHTGQHHRGRGRGRGRDRGRGRGNARC